MGYHRVGFDVVGVDIAAMPRYPFQFVQGDALEYLRDHGHEFDAIHASPPCQDHCSLSQQWKNKGRVYPNLIPETRVALLELEKPYIIENVAGARAHLISPIVICGSMFPELRVYRHRLFESSFQIKVPLHEPHNDNTPKGGSGKTSNKGFISVTGNCRPLSYCKRAMGIDWMQRDQLSQAIPPAYTQFIGKQLLEHLETVTPQFFLPDKQGGFLGASA